MTIIALVLGALFGGAVAIRKKGNALDVLQYAAVYGIGFAVLALFGSILIARLM